MCSPRCGVVATAQATWYHSRILIRPSFENLGAVLVTLDARVRLIHAQLRTPDGQVQRLPVPDRASAPRPVSRMAIAQYWVGVPPGSSVQLGSFLLPLNPEVTRGEIEIELDLETPDGNRSAFVSVALPPQ